MLTYFCCGWLFRIVFTSVYYFNQRFKICINNNSVLSDFWYWLSFNISVSLECIATPQKLLLSNPIFQYSALLLSLESLKEIIWFSWFRLWFEKWAMICFQFFLTYATLRAIVRLFFSKIFLQTFPSLLFFSSSLSKSSRNMSTGLNPFVILRSILSLPS